MDPIYAVIAALKMAYPQAEVDYFVNPASVDFEIMIRGPIEKHMVLRASNERLRELPARVVPDFRPVHVLRNLREFGIISRLDEMDEADL